MNVLSLFDGMSCGRIALDRLGIGEGNGNDEYWCEDCNVTTVYYYSKKYDKPFILGQ